MGISCRVSFKNNALEVVDKNGQPSKLYYDALALTGNEDKAIDLWYKAFSQEFTEQVRLNKDDVTLDEVLKFVSANSSFGKSLEPAEIRSIKDIMDKNSFETLSDLYKTLVGIFKPQGIIELDTVKAYQSGLFDLQGLSEINLDEIDDILDKVEGTLRVTDIYVAPSSDSSASFIDTSRKTILGTPEFISQEEIEQEIVNNVESTKDEKEISSYINSLPYSSFADRFNKEGSFRTTILNNISKYTKVNTLFIVDGKPTTKNLNYYKSLVNTINDRNNTEGLIADFEFLSDIDEDVWSQNQDDIKEVLREIEKDQFTENGIDIFGISKFSSNKFLVIDTLNSLGEMLNNTTNETIFNFAEKFIKTVPQQSSIISELLPESLEPYSENIFRVDSALNDSDLFRKFGLLKVSDNIYHKVDLGSRSNLYEELYQQAKENGYPITINAEDKEASLRDLEKYVLLQDSTVEKDIREEYMLNKIIFNHPKTQDTNDYSQLSDITTDTEYLARGFSRDFNDYIVIEKQADSQVYRDTLSKFRVTDSGVSLAVPIKSIEGLEFEKELTDYIRLKKDQSMKYLLPSRSTNLKNRVDLQAINNPASVLNYSRQYAFDNGLLVTEKVSDNYVNFFGNTYAKVAEDSANSVFKVVPKNLDANYYVTNTDFITSEDKENATQVLNDAKFSFTNSTLSEQEFDKSIEDAGIKNEVKIQLPNLTESNEINSLSNNTVDTAIEKLKQTGLASRVNLMSPDEIYERLSSLGVNLNSKKQISDNNTINKDELAQDYFTREADRLPLTLAIFNRPEFVKMQGKNVNKIAVLNSLNQSGIKQIEKDLVRSVIEDFYKGQDKVSYDELEATVRANIMPLEVLNTNSYAKYGMDNLSNGDYGDANTIILNAPIEHGVIGHFSEDFKSSGRNVIKYKPKQLNDNTWVAVQDGYENETNGNNIYQYVGTAGTKEDVDAWIENYEKPEKNIVVYSNEPYSEREPVKVFESLDDAKKWVEKYQSSYERPLIISGELNTIDVNKGMFGHIRVWTDGDIYNVAELQSDYFQKNNAKREITNSKYEKAKELALQERKEQITKDLNEVETEMYEMGLPKEASSSQLTNFGIGNIPLTVKLKSQQDNVRSNREYEAYEQEIDTIKNKTYELYAKYKQLLAEREKSDYRLIDEKDQKFIKLLDTKVQELLTPQERQFIASQKEWEKRMIRESLRLASSSGASKLRLPTPHTLSVIEGYISGDGAPYEIISADDYNRLAPGDKIDYLGSSQTVISADRDSIKIVLTEDVIKYNIEDYVDDELNYFTNEVTNSESGLDFETQYTEEEFNDADKHSSLNGVDLEDIAEKVEDGLYEISRDKLEQVVRDYFSIFYNEDNIDSILSDYGYSNINVNGNFVYFTIRDIDTETLSQPEWFTDIDKDTFSISDLSDTQQTVANKYVELAEILRKEVGEENVETVTDDQGYDWYETDVEDKYSNKAVIAFQKQLSEQGIKPIVNGFVYNNEVFLNKDTVTEETPIHEFNHLFTDWMKNNRPSLYNKGIELVKEELSKEDSDIASVINYVQQTQPDLTGEKLFEEILTELTGKEGAALIESGKKSGILDWLRSFFKEIGNMLGILDATPEQVANMTAREFAKSSAVQLLKGEDILAKAMNLRDSISYASMFGSVYSPVNDTVDSVAEELRACN